MDGDVEERNISVQEVEDFSKRPLCAPEMAFLLREADQVIVPNDHEADERSIASCSEEVELEEELATESLHRLRHLSHCVDGERRRTSLDS
jgi:hypothetical protein